MRVDMHMHTCASFDCLTDPHRLVARAQARGLDRICITDHNEIDVALELKRAYPSYIIVGEEIKTRERVDIIGLYLHEKIPAGTPARETCERIHAQGGIVYVPHPFAAGKGGGGRILPHIEALIDACEGFNARIHAPALNERAVAWGRMRKLPRGAGSDAHTLAEVGRAWVELPACADEPRAFLDALRAGTIQGSASSHLVHLASTYAKVHKWLRGRTQRKAS